MKGLQQLAEHEATIKPPDTIEEVIKQSEEHIRMQIEMRKEQLAETQKIREKYNIVCNVNNNLNFKDFMMLKTPESGFFFEYKKHRTTMLKDKEPPKKEPYYIKYIRE